MKKYFLSLLLIVNIVAISLYFVINSNNNLQDNEIVVADTKITMGDVNGDGKVNSVDYILIRKHILGIKLTGDKLKRADVNNDNSINSKDYIIIRKIILGVYNTSVAKPATITFVGKEVIATGLEGKLVVEGGVVSERRSNQLSLNTNKEYRVSFNYVTSGNSNAFSVDFYPDSLPQTSLTATNKSQYYEWVVNTSNSEIGKSQLRFFDDIRNSNEKNIVISNVMLRSVTKETYNEGSNLNSLPTISNKNFSWYTDSTCKTRVTSSTKVTKNMTLYACRDKVRTEPFAIKSNYEYIVGNINVLDYGADSSGKSDSTNAFKSAIMDANYCKNSSNCGNNNGGVVYVPSGKYKITSALSIPEGVSLVGELKEGTTSGTVLMIDYGKGTTDSAYSAIRMGMQSMVKNMAFYYPNQVLNSSGVATKYPPTIIQETSEGLTLENLTFVNSYIAMDFATHHFNNSLQYVKNIYGTPLYMGIINDTNLDTIKLDNIHFGSSYWLNSGMSNIPSSSLLQKALTNSSIKPSGLVMERVDWYFLSNISVEGYYHGILFRKSSRDANYGGAEGEMYNVNLSNCYYPMYIREAQHMAITSSTLKSNGGVALYLEQGATTDITINSSNLSSNSNIAISTANANNLSIISSTINGRINKTNGNSKMTFITDKLTNTGFERYNANLNNKTPATSNYNKKVTTMPKSNKIVVVKGSENEDITSKINNAVNSLTNGGIVYIGTGTYKISGKINVKSGVEIQGSTPWANSQSKTILIANDNAYFTLNSNSGINGLKILYNYPSNPDSVSDSAKKYIIQGSGNGIYVMNIAIINAWKGIYLNNSSNHYISHIWGSFLNNGITINGGDNGIIRDCHFTTNVLSVTNVSYAKNYKYTLEKQVSFEINNTKNQLILNSFTWGPAVGYKVNNGTNFTIIGGGCDVGSKGTLVTGSASGQLINMLLTTKATNTFSSVTVNVDPRNNPYIETNNNGFVNIINPILWGNNKTYSILLKGQGDIHISGGIIDNSASPIIKNGINALSIFGTIFKEKNMIEIENITGSHSANYTCPICTDGTCNVSNSSGINYGLNLNCIA